MPHAAMTLFVAGRSGQLARALVEQADGSEITVVTAGRPDFDVEAPRTMAERIRNADADLIINAAAYTAVDQAESEPDRAFAVNRDGARDLAAAAARLGRPLIHISTDYVFDGKKSGAYCECDPINPLSVYGRSKAEGEMAVLSANDQAIVARTAWVYDSGPGNFVAAILRAARNRDKLQVVDDQFGAPTYAPALADALLAMARRIRDTGWSPDYRGIVHATGSGETRRDEFAREILRLSKSMGGPSAVVEPVSSDAFPTAAQRPSNSRLDGSRLKAVFGVALPHWKTDLETGIRRMLDTVPGQNTKDED